MPYVTHIEQIVKERREECEKAKSEGLEQGLREAIALGLELRFGKDGSRVFPRVEAISDVGRLRQLLEAFLRGANLPEFEAVLEGR